MKKHNNGFKPNVEVFKSVQSTYSAFWIAEGFHAGQMYGDNTPYIFHLSEVESKVTSMFDEDENYLDIIAKLRKIAWLHDIVEDTHCTLDTLLECGIDSRVVQAVEAITKLDGESRSTYLDRVKKDDLAYRVKIADTLCNLEQSILSGDKRLIKKYTHQINYLTGVEETNTDA